MRLAIVGSGISGLAAAWLLKQRHEVHLFERDSRLGGHTHTVDHADGSGTISLDTGFIVFNHATYPHLTRMFDELDVATQPGDMSFGISCSSPDFEYGVGDLNGLFAQRRHLLSPAFWGMLRDIVRFGSAARRVLAETPDPSITLEHFLESEKLGGLFARGYLLPMASAIWSSGTDATAGFPRDALLRFLDNHGLLTISGQPQWFTVTGGSRTYVRRIAHILGDRVHVGHGIRTIVRHPSEVVLVLEDGSQERFDGVIVAAHADQALALLESPTDAERELLGAWEYSANDTWLHTDTELMPRRRRAWASWNYLLDDLDHPTRSVSLSYHLNRLQRLATDTDFMVTLNPTSPPRANRVIRRMTYHHPVYSRASVATQAELNDLNGHRRTWFCGAYFGNGFHEDGLDSAIRVAAELGVVWP